MMDHGSRGQLLASEAPPLQETQDVDGTSAKQGYSTHPRTQRKWHEGGQATRKTHHQPVAMWRHGAQFNCELLQVSEKALLTAYRLTFPGEALNMNPNGRYAWLEELLHSFGRGRPEKVVESRHFVSRIAHDGIILKNMMCLALSDQWPELVARLGPPYRDLWVRWAQTFTTCCAKKPDVKHLGYVTLSPEKFQLKFDGSNSAFVHHMYERHHGETIEIHRQSVTSVDNPRSASMHHPQLFVEAHRDGPQIVAMNKAAAYFKLPTKKKTKDVTDEFLHYQATVPNSVFKPQDHEGHTCSQVEVCCHSLPSLVYECCDVADLFEIYTWFCSVRTLTSMAPHSTSAPKWKWRL